jgi:hypothetical protein
MVWSPLKLTFETSKGAVDLTSFLMAQTKSIGLVTLEVLTGPDKGTRQGSTGDVLYRRSSERIRVYTNDAIVRALHGGCIVLSVTPERCHCENCTKLPNWRYNGKTVVSELLLIVLIDELHI